MPSTLIALVTRQDPLAATFAAGRILLPDERRALPLVLAALPVHLGISAFWGGMLARVLPARGAPLWGALGGLAIAAIDLRLPGRRVEAVRGLPVFPQVLDHVVFGAVVGIHLRRQALSLR